ncbi:uncharacterized protein LOC131939304 [Physella acuta]|uniref:uncharacterized protein LOC131939304 n=1 Tax=Physella acuta TaxID=109671 RepID=UPI0027DE2413|nr:uncharacterized protein LOC131939304 [Physella acuta]
MADESDVPPLEDMTDTLRKAEAIRTGLTGEVLKNKPAAPKDRAKVRKNITARVIQPENLGDGNVSNAQKVTSSRIEEIESAQSSAGDNSVVHKPSTENSTGVKKPSTEDSTAVIKPSAGDSNTAVNKPSSGLFGGMKKGFLFGGPSKVSKPSTIASKTGDSSAPKTKASPVEQDDTIPFVRPTGSSSLTLEEVQQAMSETKGLLDNQDWITDDLLSKVEKNEFLLKRFADPTFMNALHEFQTNPVAAMEKYKSNKEVEKFLMEFCGLLGDHFTNMTSSPSPQSNQIPQPKPQQPQNNSKPKIIEITEANQTKVPTPKKPVETKEQTTSLPALNLPNKGVKDSHINVETQPAYQAEITQVPPIDDAEVKELLKDPKTMEILLDPKVMQLIQLLKQDPEKARSMVEKADGDLRDKISFLVGKRLLQFQIY